MEMKRNDKNMVAQWLGNHVHGGCMLPCVLIIFCHPLMKSNGFPNRVILIKEPLSAVDQEAIHRRESQG